MSAVTSPPSTPNLPYQSLPPRRGLSIPPPSDSFMGWTGDAAVPSSRPSQSVVAPPPMAHHYAAALLSLADTHPTIAIYLRPLADLLLSQEPQHASVTLIVCQVLAAIATAEAIGVALPAMAIGGLLGKARAAMRGTGAVLR